MIKVNLEDIKRNMNRDNLLSEYACKNADAIRLGPNKNDIRPPFFRDTDKIIYSLSYTRYIDKTQVFSNTLNDNISKRMTHVQMVSKIARTIGRALNLNEDLIEAAALGHDIGHVPFGHVGEKILNDISLAHNEGYFNHNIQSVRELMFLENNGRGCNLNLQVYDAIMCHNGELELSKYQPKLKTLEQFMDEYYRSYQDKEVIKKMIPMTLEGCVVRVSDIVAYVGRDIEDAIRLKKLNIEDVPESIRKILGSTNKDIVNTFVMDIIENSYGKDYITMSKDMFKTLKELKKFNYKYIYSKANSKKTIEMWTMMFNKLFDYYLNCLNNNDKKSSIYQVFLKEMNVKYKENTTKERMVIDYLAGMTDEYFINEFNKINY